MIEYRPARDRFRTVAEGRTTWHSFSFGAHYDPANVGFETLVAHNDEHLPPGTGYADHPHADLEIVTWVLSGALRHTSEVAEATGDSAGETRFLQAWVRPDEPDLVPDYLSSDVTLGEGWTCVADGDGRGVVPLAAAGTSLHAADPASGDRLLLPDAPRLHLFLARGHVMLGERLLEPRENLVPDPDTGNSVGGIH